MQTFKFVKSVIVVVALLASAASVSFAADSQPASAPKVYQVVNIDNKDQIIYPIDGSDAYELIGANKDQFVVGEQVYGVIKDKKTGDIVGVVKMKNSAATITPAAQPAASTQTVVVVPGNAAPAPAPQVVVQQEVVTLGVGNGNGEIPVIVGERVRTVEKKAGFFGSKVGNVISRVAVGAVKQRAIDNSGSKNTRMIISGAADGVEGVADEARTKQIVREETGQNTEETTVEYYMIAKGPHVKVFIGQQLQGGTVRWVRNHDLKVNGPVTVLR